MTGPVALHGGGEFLPGDEPFLRALLDGAAASRDDARTGARPLRVVVIPVAAARHAPELAARHGVEAFRRVAAAAGVAIDAAAALVVDAASAVDAGVVSAIADADLIHLPGGDPDLVPTILQGSPAWLAALAAHGRGAVLTGASAGAMGLAAQTWSPRGWLPGLGVVGGFIVLPHLAQFDGRGREADIERVERDQLSVLGLDERTGVIRRPDGRWLVAGEGRAMWRTHGSEPVFGRHGDVLDLGA